MSCSCCYCNEVSLHYMSIVFEYSFALYFIWDLSTFFSRSNYIFLTWYYLFIFQMSSGRKIYTYSLTNCTKCHIPSAICLYWRRVVPLITAPSAIARVNCITVLRYCLELSNAQCWVFKIFVRDIFILA